MLDFWSHRSEVTHMPVSEMSIQVAAYKFVSLLLYIYSHGVLKEYLRVRFYGHLSDLPTQPLLD